MSLSHFTTSWRFSRTGFYSNQSSTDNRFTQLILTLSWTSLNHGFGDGNWRDLEFHKLFSILGSPMPSWCKWSTVTVSQTLFGVELGENAEPIWPLKHHLIHNHHAFYNKQTLSTIEPMFFHFYPSFISFLFHIFINVDDPCWLFLYLSSSCLLSVDGASPMVRSGDGFCHVQLWLSYTFKLNHVVLL